MVVDRQRPGLRGMPRRSEPVHLGRRARRVPPGRRSRRPLGRGGRGLVAPNGRRSPPTAPPWSSPRPGPPSHRLEVGEGGSFTDRRVVADVGDDWPDGICLDQGGGVWMGGGLGCHSCGWDREAP